MTEAKKKVKKEMKAMDVTVWTERQGDKEGVRERKKQCQGPLESC